MMEFKKHTPGQAAVDMDCQHCGLKSFSAFQDCSEELLESIFTGKRFVRFQINDIIVSQHEPFKGVYCIQEGKVKVCTFGSKNREFILWYAKPGDVIGMDSFINRQAHLFTAVAASPVSACFIPESDLKKLMAEEPSIAKRLIKILCEEINFIESRIPSVSQKSVREQFAEVLLSMAAKGRQASGVNDPINYSIRDLANTIGTTNNYLYKIISDFNEKNVVAIQNKKLVIKDFDKLSLIAIGDESGI